MARGKRETFILNPLNPKDKIILDFLDKQFNRSETIRDILYNYASSKNGNAITMALPYDDNSITNVLPQDDNSITIPLQYNDNTFKIDVNSIEDDYVEVKTEDKEINANEEALNYLNNWR
jgi:hypothetical protein